MNKRRIGILGGSFNPPHLGHLHMAEQAKVTLNLSEVWLLVSPQNPLKETAGMASFEARMRMCNLMAADKPWLKASDFEVKAGTRFTADTVEKLTTSMPDVTFFWLMGADNLAQFHQWKNWENIVNTVPIVVFRRPGTDITHIKGPAVDYLAPYQVDTQDKAEKAPNWRVLENKLIDLSATNIRNEMHQGAVTQADTALHTEVLSYIQQNGLYENMGAK